MDDVTYFKKLWIKIKKLHDNVDFIKSYFFLEKLANEAGIKNLTLDVAGCAFLYYPISMAEFDAFDTTVSRLLDLFR